VGPGWAGDLPADIKRINAPTRWILIQPRVHVAGKDDLPAAKAVLDAITVEGLAQATGKTPPAPPTYCYAAPETADPKLPVSALACGGCARAFPAKDQAWERRARRPLRPV